MTTFFEFCSWLHLIGKEGKFRNREGTAPASSAAEDPGENRALAERCQLLQHEQVRGKGGELLHGLLDIRR